MGDGGFEPDSWDWHDDSFKLDFHSSHEFSRSFWDEFPEADGDSLPFLTSTPVIDMPNASPDLETLDKQDISIDFPHNISSEGSNICSKRRRMLVFSDSKHDTSTSCEAFLEPILENLDSSSAQDMDIFLLTDPASSSSWESNSYGFDPFADDTCSGPEEGAKHNPEESLFRTTPLPVLDVMSVAGATVGAEDIQEVFLPRRVAAPSSKRSAPAILGSASKKQKFATPVAYPFALVKPSKAQGDVTLNDINERILSPVSRPQKRRHRSQTKSLSESGLGLSGKSIVALTKIHTEGNGSITIMRTKC